MRAPGCGCPAPPSFSSFSTATAQSGQLGKLTFENKQKRELRKHFSPSCIRFGRKADANGDFIRRYLPVLKVARTKTKTRIKTKNKCIFSR